MVPARGVTRGNRQGQTQWHHHPQSATLAPILDYVANGHWAVPAQDLLTEALGKTPREEARRLDRGLRQLGRFTSDDLPGKSARAVSEAILTARNITGRRDLVTLPSRGA
jgi:hypothetical protein